MLANAILDNVMLAYAMLLLMSINVAGFTTDSVVTNHVTTPKLRRTYKHFNATGTGGGKNITMMGDGELAYDPMYTRLIPAVTTIGLFLVGVFTIYLIYCLKQKESHKKQAEPIEDEQVNNDWLAELKKTQKKSSIGNVFARRGSTFNAKMKIKKYALYDEMLARYKRSLKMQKLHSMRKTNTTTSNLSQSTDSYDETGTGPIRKVSSKMRMKELAMRHKISQEHHSQFDIHLEPQSRQRYLPRWGTTTSSNVSQDESENLFRSDLEMDAFREGLDKSMDISSNVSFHISTDDDTEPLLTSSSKQHQNTNLIAVASRRPSKKASPSSKNESMQSSIDKDDDNEVINSNIGGADIDDNTGDVLGDVFESTVETNGSRNMMDQPDIAVALRKLSNVEDAPVKPSTTRPKSMITFLSGGLINSGLMGDGTSRNVDKATQRRQSWYQGLFRSPSKQPLGNTTSVDDLIESHVTKALYSRLASGEYSEEESNNLVSPGGSKERNPNLRQRPKSWMPPSENQRKKQNEQKTKDSITELFANLMDLPSIAKRERSWYDNIPSDLSTTSHQESPTSPHELDHNVEGVDQTSPSMTEKEEMMLINEVERRMIENIEDNDMMHENEVIALENLLNDVARFCTEYSEDYEDVESRRQISFSEANATLSRSKKPLAIPKSEDSFDGRAAKVMSVYDTQLLQAKSSDPTTTL